MNAITELNPTVIHATIKLGVDAHAKWFYVARQVDGATPQPIQKTTFDGLLRFVGKTAGPRPRGLHLLRIERSEIDCQQGCPKGRRGSACQPGAFGYHLHRKLTAMGVTNYVVQPHDGDERARE